MDSDLEDDLGGALNPEHIELWICGFVTNNKEHPINMDKVFKTIDETLYTSSKYKTGRSSSPSRKRFKKSSDVIKKNLTEDKEDGDHRTLDKQKDTALVDPDTVNNNSLLYNSDFGSSNKLVSICDKCSDSGAGVDETVKSVSLLRTDTVDVDSQSTLLSQPPCMHSTPYKKNDKGFKTLDSGIGMEDDNMFGFSDLESENECDESSPKKSGRNEDDLVSDSAVDCTSCIGSPNHNRRDSVFCSCLTTSVNGLSINISNMVDRVCDSLKQQQGSSSPAHKQQCDNSCGDSDHLTVNTSLENGDDKESPSSIDSGIADNTLQSCDNNSDQNTMISATSPFSPSSTSCASPIGSGDSTQLTNSLNASGDLPKCTNTKSESGNFVKPTNLVKDSGKGLVNGLGDLSKQSDSVKADQTTTCSKKSGKKSPLQFMIRGQGCLHKA